MGFNVPQWKFVNKCFVSTGLLSQNKKLPKFGTILENENYYGKKMLELGCQEIRRLVKERLLSKGTSRSYFKSIGIKHTSIDKKGCHRSHKKDLTIPLGEDYYNRFDIVTNSGTTEHIVPLKGQYPAFKNIHLCTKVEGIMLHILPGIGKYYGHCQTYYDKRFFKMLAKLNNYDIVLMENVKKRKNFIWTGVCFRKKEDNKFTTNENDLLKYLQWINKKVMKNHRKNRNKYLER